LWDSLDAQPTERLLTLARTGATVRVQELGDGPPVVFVHGASNAGTSWAPLVSRLAGFHCILVDRPGCGLSPRLPVGLADMSRFDVFADALVVDVLDAIGVADAHVVGTSFGGYFALRTAAAHPERTIRVVELGWTVGAPMESTPLVMRIATLPRLGRLVTKIPPTEGMTRSMLKQIGLRNAVDSGRFGSIELGWFRSLLRDTDTMRNEIDAAPRIMTMRGFNDDTLLPVTLLEAIEAPTFFLWGEQDPMGGAALAQEFVQQLPRAELEMMPAAGHAPWIDDPDRVASTVGAFLRR
jgi:2-hydroxy-6-oxonona-2,4-dienedioate hydrolase